MLKRDVTIRLNGHAIHLDAYRGIAIGICRRFMRPSSVFLNNARQDVRAEASEADNEESMNAEQWMGHIADLQAAHSSHVAGMIYGRRTTEQPGTTAHRREMFRLSSTDWRRFLGFVSTDDAGVGGRERVRTGPVFAMAERSGNWPYGASVATGPGSYGARDAANDGQ